MQPQPLLPMSQAEITRCAPREVRNSRILATSHCYSLYCTVPRQAPEDPLVWVLGKGIGHRGENLNGGSSSEFDVGNDPKRILVAWSDRLDLPGCRIRSPSFVLDVTVKARRRGSLAFAYMGQANGTVEVNLACRGGT